jgi:hypothetical protein
MRKRRALEIRRATVGQHALASDRVQQLACPPDQIEQSIELGEATPVDVGHLAAILTVVRGTGTSRDERGF